jgi:hypothetical protein
MRHPRFDHPARGVLVANGVVVAIDAAYGSSLATVQ